MTLNLETKIEEIPKIGAAYQKKLKKLGIMTVRDLLYHFPARYDDFSNIITISEIKGGFRACVRGRIIEIGTTKTFKKWMDITEATIEDETGAARALWFNQPYIEKSLKEGDLVCLAGKISVGKGGLYFNNPAYEKVYTNNDDSSIDLTHTGRIVPVYPETKGLTSKWLRYIIKPLLTHFYDKMPEILPDEILKKHKFLPIRQSFRQVHFPDSFESADAAKARFSFENLFLLQIYILRERVKLTKKTAFPCPMNADLMKKFTNSLPFQLTDSQKQCAYQILKDLEKPVPMSRLLEGDVGSGKTVVATMAALNAAKNGGQIAFMAPTEILAKQHFKTVSDLLADFEIKIGFLTGRESRFCLGKEIKETRKKELLGKLKNGGIDILIGTHSLIQKSVEFENLVLLVVDEQHRFGVGQRAKLIARGNDAELTRKYADVNGGERILHEHITYKIRGAAFNVRKSLGGGHSELIYQRAFAEEMKNFGLVFDREKKIDIQYKGKKIDVYQIDFIVENSVVVELKALPFLGTAVKSQIWKYLKCSDFKLALVINFGATKLEIERLVYDKARTASGSASIPHSSAYVPHLLSMTATPIPRTLALTVYGDLDLSLIKEMPKNRKKVKTVIVGPQDRKAAYEFIRGEIIKGHGVFVICPKIEPKNGKQSADWRMENGSQNGKFFEVKNYIFNPGITDMKAVKEEYEKLSKEVFPDLTIAMLHGKMKPKEKEKIMLDFKNGKSDILVSTSVVEVGVDAPRATVMMIEGAERFGLAQLHQFRGRVGRSGAQSYCFLFTTEPSQLNRKRLKALVECDNGFELAQKDLEIRGPGQLYGSQQWGIPDTAMEGISNIFLVEKTRAAAKEILEKDPELKNYPILMEELSKFRQKIHFE